MTNHHLAKLALQLIVVLTVVLTLVLLPNPAARAAEPPGAPTAVAGPASPAPAATSDPNLDRGFLLPTAMTQPKGSLTYNNYELLLHGVTYGFTDHVQGSVTVLSPITRDMPIVGFGALKWRFFDNGRVHLAAQASAGFGNFRAGASDSLYSAGAGMFASVCLRDDCQTLLSASATYQLVQTATTTTPDGQSTSGRAQTLIYGASLVHAVSPHVKLLLEVGSAAAGTVSSNDGFDNFPGLVASYGVRFHNANLAADLGFVRPILTDGSRDEFLVGLPFASVSYRWR